MRHQYKRERSEFWITIHENENDSYTITTTEKYIIIINRFFPLLQMISPKGWTESNMYPGLYNLWLPTGVCSPATIEDFMSWCERVTQDVLWLGKNKNIATFFEDELDFCIASDFNYHYGADRTEMGEAEYNLKYNIHNLSASEKSAYLDFVMNRMLESARYIPVHKGGEWVVSPMPATVTGRDKLAWQMAENLAEHMGFELIVPHLCCEKPEMKKLAIEEKINVWNNIYNSGNVTIEDDIMRKNVILFDDLYQSGTTMWQYARFLKELGAKSVWGLVCVKSLKDSDNK